MASYLVRLPVADYFNIFVDDVSSEDEAVEKALPIVNNVLMSTDYVLDPGSKDSPTAKESELSKFEIQEVNIEGLKVICQGNVFHGSLNTVDVEECESDED